MELVQFEIELLEHGTQRHWTATIELEDINHWYPAAIRWLTNLCATLSTVNGIEPIGALHCRRKDTAIYDPISDSFRLPDYKYYGRIEESEWKIA